MPLKFTTEQMQMCIRDAKRCVMNRRYRIVRGEGEGGGGGLQFGKNRFILLNKLTALLEKFTIDIFHQMTVIVLSIKSQRKNVGVEYRLDVTDLNKGIAQSYRLEKKYVNFHTQLLWMLLAHL